MDKLIGAVLCTLAMATVTAQLASAVGHDCSYNPPLPSSAFGYQVPIAAICSAVSVR